MPEPFLSSLPEQGQIVTVRQRRFAVAEVRASALPANVLAQPLATPQHLITLNAIDDEGLGESIQVLWEIEQDTRIEERLGLPDVSGFDPPRRLDAFLNAVQWGAVSTADIKWLQAPFRSGIEIEDYQLDPLVRAVQMPRVNLLIADDVGLGKTIEAGLIVQELLVRNRARTVMVVCPAALQVQWRDQMRDKFGLEFRIVDSELMTELRRSRGIHTNPWTHFPRLITSIDFLKRDRPLRLMREVLPLDDAPKYPRRFDLLIIDEAHNVAPVGRGHYATDSLRTLAIRTLAPHFEHKLFLSATPHNGYKESFTALLELLDNQRFARGVEPDRQQLQAIMVRRLKSELPPQWDGKPRFPQRHLEALEVQYGEDERQAHAWLREYTTLRQSNARDEVERYATEFVLKLLKKRLFSSPAAFAATLAQHEQSITTAQKPGAQASRRPAPSILRQYLDQVDEEYADDDAYESAAGEALGTATSLFHPLNSEERDLLTRMRRWAEESAKRADSKTRKLLDWLKEVVRPGGQWCDERVIIFTEYRATQKWLQERLAAEGLSRDGRLLTLYGGMNTLDREQIKAAFQADPAVSPVRILLATDAASEGIDLQNFCYRVVHVEIPWNPNRLEQRNGRVDRHGQKHDVQIFHFVGAGYRNRATVDALTGGKPQTLEADLEFLMRAAEKIEQIREDLGKVGPVIAQQVEEAMLGRRARLQTDQAERDSEAVRRMLKFERDLKAAIARQMQQLDETRRELHLSPDHIYEVVETALQIAGQPALIPLQMPGGVDGKPLTAYRLPALRGSWAACSEGLAHPHTGAIRPLVFDHELARGRDDIVLAHLNHRLVQMSLRLLRAEVWSPASLRGLHRVTARVAPNTILRTPAVIGHARLVVISGNSARLHEEIMLAGGWLREGRFQRMNLGEMQDALAAATHELPPQAITERMRELWPQISGPLQQALDARMRTRTEAIQKLLAERRGQEISRITSVLNELQSAILAELHQPEMMQLELFTSDEREQARRNQDALQLRLSQIPGEIESETAAIETRYAEPEPRLFPVAVTFLVPERT